MEPQKTIFLSYCHKDAEHADSIDKDLSMVGLNIRRDVRDVSYKYSFKDFMRKIRQSDHAVMLLSKDFLHSANCMFEMSELLKDEDYNKRILPVMVRPLSIFKPEGRVKLIKYWQDEEKRLKEEAQGIEPVNLGPLSADLKKAQEISASVGSFISTVADMKLLTSKELKSSSYKELLEAMGYNEDTVTSQLMEIAAIEDEEERDNSIDQFIRQNPKTPETYFVKANIESDKLKFNRAIAYYKEAIELNPQNAPTWYNIGVAFANLNKLQEAISAYKMALEIYPQYFEALYNLGSALGKLGRHKESLTFLEEALKIDQNKAEVWNNKGIALGELQKYSGALYSFDQALRIKPDLAEAWYNKGGLLEKLKRFEDSLSAFEHALVINPNYSSCWLQKGVTLLNLGREEEAKQAFVKARELEPELFEKKDE